MATVEDPTIIEFDVRTPLGQCRLELVPHLIGRSDRHGRRPYLSAEGADITGCRVLRFRLDRQRHLRCGALLSRSTGRARTLGREEVSDPDAYRPARAVVARSAVPA